MVSSERHKKVKKLLNYYTYENVVFNWYREGKLVLELILFISLSTVISIWFSIVSFFAKQINRNWFNDDCNTGIFCSIVSTFFRGFQRLIWFWSNSIQNSIQNILIFFKKLWDHLYDHDILGGLFSSFIFFYHFINLLY